MTDAAIAIDGRPLHFRSRRSLREHRVTFVHQHLGLLPSLTVLENLLLSDLAVEIGGALTGARNRGGLAIFRRYDLRLDPAGNALTPVERAQLAILRAFEQLRRRAGPGAREDSSCSTNRRRSFPRMTSRLFKLIREIVADGASVIFVSHDIDEVLEITDRATVLRDGRVAGAFETKGMAKAEVVRLIVGRHVDLEAMRPAARTFGRSLRSRFRT